MRRLFIVIFTLIFVSQPSFAVLDQAIRCRFFDETKKESINLEIYLEEFNRYVIYRNDSTGEVSAFPVIRLTFDALRTTLEGLLPTPWNSGTKFKIILDEESWFYSFQISEVGTANSSPRIMTCEDI